MNRYNNHFSQEISIFHGIPAPETGILVGYAALIDALHLPIPIPQVLSLISLKHRQYEQAPWQVFTIRHQPLDTLYNHLVFALKYEGIDLLFFKKLFQQIGPKAVEKLINNEPKGVYCRKIWFLYEWLLRTQLDIPNLQEGNYVLLVNEHQQYAWQYSFNSQRHRIKNNLPGMVDFCPLIRRTPALEQAIQADWSGQINKMMKQVHSDIWLRTSAFLLLKDSKASFSIEGENPVHSRAVRWGKAIGQAGKHELHEGELLRLQQIVIGDSRFIKMGYRTEGGFVGEHDRSTGDPIPEHISARPQDVEVLMRGLLIMATTLRHTGHHPVLAAAAIAFGFVFIHPFVDGNGRLHRYLVHHILAQMGFTPPGLIFPISAAILDRIDTYRQVLESYSKPLLDFIKWEKTSSNNVEVLNDTIDYYRYFDATAQAEFLFACVADTVQRVIPEEVQYLEHYKIFKEWLDNHFNMPDKMVSLLTRFLEQKNGVLSKRARNQEFAMLTNEEVNQIEQAFASSFKRD